MFKVILHGILRTFFWFSIIGGLIAVLLSFAYFFGPIGFLFGLILFGCAGFGIGTAIEDHHDGRL
jgi:hypothetical protein